MLVSELSGLHDFCLKCASIDSAVKCLFSLYILVTLDKRMDKTYSLLSGR